MSTALKDAETVAAAQPETRSAGAIGNDEDDPILREVNLTRSLSEESQRRTASRESLSQHDSESGPLDLPTTKKKFVTPPLLESDQTVVSDDKPKRSRKAPDFENKPTHLEQVSDESEVGSGSGSSQAKVRLVKETFPQPITSPNAGQSRLDLITGEWTLYATTRSQRPDQFANVVTKSAPVTDCPFCVGQESCTPDAVWSAKLDDDEDNSESLGKPDWSVRVVPNLYPAVTDCRVSVSSETDNSLVDQDLPESAQRYRAAEALSGDTSGNDALERGAGNPPKPSPLSMSRLFASEPATGGHEVIIESPRHTESFGELNTAEIALVFAAYAQRIRHWQNVPGIRHVSVFKNVGRDAGASLQHSHSQLIATNRVPAVVQNVTQRMQVHHAHTGSCMQCDLIRGEIERKSRVVSQTDHFLAYCPFASRFPMQVRVSSKEHLACFGEMRSSHIAEVARLVLRVVRWLEALRPGTAYNVLLHTCPIDFQGARDSQHWALDIFPRMSRLAGFELATGAMINPLFPETAAKAYRDQARKSDPRYVLR